MKVQLTLRPTLADSLVQPSSGTSGTDEDEGNGCSLSPRISNHNPSTTVSNTMNRVSIIGTSVQSMLEQADEQGEYDHMSDPSICSDAGTVSSMVKNEINEFPLPNTIGRPLQAPPRLPSVFAMTGILEMKPTAHGNTHSNGAKWKTIHSPSSFSHRHLTVPIKDEKGNVVMVKPGAFIGPAA